MVALLYRRLADLVRRFVLPSLRGTIPPMFSADVGAARAALCVSGVGETIPVGEPDPPRASLLRKNGMLRKSLYVRSNLLSAGPPKMTVGACWAAWEEGGSASSGSEFLQRVASWIEGTAAQLLRDHWRTGAKRPSSTELQERLRHHLALVLLASHLTTMKSFIPSRRLSWRVTPSWKRSAGRGPRPPDAAASAGPRTFSGRVEAGAAGQQPTRL